MAVLPIAKIGNPILRKIASPVPLDVINTSAFQQFIDDMFETMYENDGIGLAAPQVSRSVGRLFKRRWLTRESYSSLEHSC